MLQVVPHPPQLFGSWFVATQAPLQSTKPAEQASVQEPPAQTSPAAQLVPHEPQFSGSWRVFTHESLQSDCPGGQTTSSPPHPASSHAASSVGTKRIIFVIGFLDSDTSHLPNHSIGIFEKTPFYRTIVTTQVARHGATVDRSIVYPPLSAIEKKSIFC